MPLGNPIRKQNESRMVSVLATEGQTVFTVQGGYIVNQISVFRNGVRLSPAEDFTAGDGSTVTLNDAANVEDRIDFHIFDRFTVQNAIVGAASSQTISGDVVVNGKIFGNLDVPQINVASGIVTTHDLNVSGVGTFTDKLHLLDGDKLHLGGAAGDNGDLQLFHDGSNSYIEDSGTGNLFIESDSSVILRNDGGGVDFAKFINGGGVELYHNNVERFTTTYSGADITGTLNVTGVSTFTDDITFTGAASNIIFDKSDNALEFTDDAKATFGTDADCTFTHSGSDFAITETTGNINLLCNSSGNIHLRHNSESMLRAITNDTVEIYYNNSKRLHTTPSGVDVTGTLNVTGVSTFTTNQVKLYNSTDNSNTYFYAQNTGAGNAGIKMKNSSGEWTIIANDRLRFMDDDAGIERLSIESGGDVGINTDNPTVKLDISEDSVAFPSAAGSTLLRLRNSGGSATLSIDAGASSNSVIQFGDTAAASVGTIQYSHTTNHLQFNTNGDGEKMRITSGGLVGVNQTNPIFTLDLKRAGTDIIRMNNSGETTHGNVDAKMVAGGTYYQNFDFHGYLYKFQTYNGSSLGERLRITKDGQVLIGTDVSLSFNGVGQNHNLIVAGASSDTDITDNYNAAITISNTDGTANNTAGLHFAREDNDGNPHYTGAAVVAQFLETMNDGHYPKTDLAFLTSTANNNAPSQKMRLYANGEVLSASQFVSKTTAEYNASVSTASGWSSSSSYNIVLAEDVLDNHSVYIVNFSWNHQGSGQPYLVDGAFVFQPGATNPGGAGAMGPTFTPVQGSHTEQGVTKYFNFRYYSPTGTHVHGLQAASTMNLNDANGNGSLQIKIFKIGAETTI